MIKTAAFSIAMMAVFSIAMMAAFNLGVHFGKENINRYSLHISEGKAAVFDTQTGTIKGLGLSKGMAGTWEKNYSDFQ